MKHVLRHKDASVICSQINPSRHTIKIEPTSDEVHITIREWETNYPVDLIDKMLQIKGPAYLCDDIMRDESPDYVEKYIYFSVFSYLSADRFENKKVLDFGCGTGASTMVLSRLLQKTDIVGVELDEELLEIAKARAAYYRLGDRVHFFASPDGNSLPVDIGNFDYIFLNAVLEHLLPLERKVIMPLLWNHLNPGGIIFVNQTPYRWFPVEFHTTGLVFINYLPDFLAHLYARRFYRPYDWPKLLRQGIRGTSVREIESLLDDTYYRPIVLEPSQFEFNDRIDIWWAMIGKSRHIFIKKAFFYLCKAVKRVSGMVFLPTLSVAIQKPRENNGSSKMSRES